MLMSLAAACSVLAACWYWTGLFGLLASAFQAISMFVSTDAQIRKVILLRDADLGAICLLHVGISTWLQRSVSLMFVHALPAILQVSNMARHCWYMRGHIVWYFLLKNSLIPLPANALSVSAANLQSAMEQNDCLLDVQTFTFVSASLTTVLTLLAAPGAASLSDIVSFSAQFILQLKAPLDAYALRLKRIGSIARALVETRDAEYEPVSFDAADKCPQIQHFGCQPADWFSKARFFEDAVQQAFVLLIPAKRPSDHFRMNRTYSVNWTPSDGPRSCQIRP